MQSGDKDSFKIFESIRDDYVVPSLAALGFYRARRDQYEQLRDDTINRVTLHGRTDRRGDYCLVDVYLSIGYRQAGELLAKHLGKKKEGLDNASITTPLNRVMPSTGAWNRGLDDPKDWSNLLPQKDPAVLGPILVDQLKRFAIPYFEARSSMSVVLDPSGLKPDGPDYERHLILRPACLWVSGSHQAAIDLLKAREMELREDCRVRWSLMCAKHLERVTSFRMFLEAEGR